MIIRALALSLLALSLSPGGHDTQVPLETVPQNLDAHGQQIFFAVLEGLYRDGVPSDLVDRITAIDDQTHYPRNFVWACPVCMPAYEAFCVYRARPGFHDKEHSDTFGPGLPKEQVERLAAVDLAVSQRAIEELIQNWMDRRMDELRLTADERTEWRNEMAKRRKLGMTYLEGYRNAGLGGSYAGMKTCPICEGANGACRAR